MLNDTSVFQGGFLEVEGALSSGHRFPGQNRWGVLLTWVPEPAKLGLSSWTLVAPLQEWKLASLSDIHGIKQAFTEC